MTVKWPEKVLVIDDDDVVCTLVTNYLTQLGIATIDTASDGTRGWELAVANNYDAVILDWKLPGLSGVAMFNRFRKHRDYRMTPIVAISGFLEQEDFRLLGEFPGTALLEKPFTRTLLEEKLAKVVNECNWYNTQSESISELLESFPDNRKSAVSGCLKLIKASPNPTLVSMIVADHFVEFEYLKDAEKILTEVLKASPDSLQAMNALAKILIKGSRFDEALDLLRKCNKISPQNLARLCVTGDAELNVDDAEGAKNTFAAALEIDGDDSIANAGYTVAKSFSDYLTTKASVGNLASGFASTMNTIGISFVRNGQYDKGFEHYESAVKFIRDDKIKARVLFNLGLGNLRAGNLKEALPWFEESASIAGADFAKSKTYVRKVTGLLSRLEKLSQHTNDELIAQRAKARVASTEAAAEEVDVDESNALESAEELISQKKRGSAMEVADPDAEVENSVEISENGQATDEVDIAAEEEDKAA